MEKKVQSFLKELQKEESLPSLILLHGEEEFLKRSLVERLRDRLGRNLQVLWGDEAELEELTGNLMEGDIFGGTARRAVLVKDFEKFVKKNLRSKKALGIFLNSLQRATSIFVAEVSGRLKNPDLAREPFKTFKEKGIVLTADRVPLRKVKETVKKRFEREGVPIEEDALDLLVEMCDGNLMILKGEVEKLLLYSAGEPIKRETVSRVCAGFSSGDPFGLSDSFFEKDLSLSLKNLKSLLSEGSYPLQLSALLENSAIRLHGVKKMVKEGIGQDEAMARAGIRAPFQKAKLSGHLKKWSDTGKLIRAFCRFERDVKAGFGDPAKALEGLIISTLIHE